MTPTTVIAGTYDMQADPNSQRALAAGLRNATFHLFEAGHGVLFTSPEAVRLTIDALGAANTQHALPLGEPTT